MSILGEIKRRKVFQVAAVYAVVAWLIIQIVDVVGEPLTLPSWIDAVVIVLLAVGFPIAVILAWAFDLTPQGIRADSEIQGSSLSAQVGGQRLNYLLQGLVLVAVGFLVIDQYVLEPGARVRAVGGPTSPSPASSANVRRTNINLGVTEALGNTGLRAHVALSPDGRRLVYAAQVDGTSQLYLRALDQLEARSMPGTEGAFYPAFSPDGEWVVFHTDSAGVKKVSVRGGQPQTLTSATFGGGFSWVTDETIIYGTGGATVGRSLFRISANGGTPEDLVEPEPGTGHVRPEVLPGGDAVLFVIKPGDGGGGPASDGRIAVLSLETDDIRNLVEGAHTPRYAPTGHILFVRSGDLWAVPFDAERLETTGPEVPVVHGVAQDGVRGGAAYAISSDGMLVYAPGDDAALGGRTLVWVDREGREEALAVEQRGYMHPQLSPDGQRVAVVDLDGTNPDLWIIDLMRGTSGRITFNPGEDRAPLWTPNGEQVAFWSARGNQEESGLYRQAADGTGQAEQLTSSVTQQHPETFSPDGSQLVFRETGTGGDDLYILALDDEGASRPLMQGAFFEGAAAISPNGRWIAYHSDESGELNIYVRPFPNVGDAKWQISIDGGMYPRWGPEGGELFYRNGIEMLAVSVEGEDTFSAETPEALFTASYWGPDNVSSTYDISPDGQRFMMLKEFTVSEQQASDQTVLVAVENWFEELRRLAPPQE